MLLLVSWIDLEGLRLFKGAALRGPSLVARDNFEDDEEVQWSVSVYIGVSVLSLIADCRPSATWTPNCDQE